MIGFGLLLSLTLLAGCSGKDGDTAEDLLVHPRLVMGPEDRLPLLEKLQTDARAQWLFSVVEDKANTALEEPDLAVWDHGAHGHNGEVAEARAFLAWFNQDEAMAASAKEALALLDDDWDSTATWDVNIRMVDSLFSYSNAHDFLSGTDWFSEEEAAEVQDKLTTINRAFYNRYIASDAMRQLILGTTQNNHVIRTAVSLAYVALAFPDDPDASVWLDFATSELDYLWGLDGQYVQADGGVSEGPLYYAFAVGAAIGYFHAANRVIEPDHAFTRTCINRQDVEPWAGHGCVEGEEYLWANPLHEPLFWSTMDWYLAIRLPWGDRPPLADARFGTLNGSALMAPYGGSSTGIWGWETQTGETPDTTGSAPLTLHHLLLLDETHQGVEPEEGLVYLPDAGNAVFRSGWDEDAIWGLLLGESGSARMTVHDHVDGTSFTMAAYGEYLLLDPGYYKPNELSNAVTAQGDAHNVILVDGQGAPDKGLLTNFGDVDATLENPVDGAAVDYVESWQSYEDVDIQRGVSFVRDRYFVISDRLEGGTGEDRTYQWRMNGYAGLDSGGEFSVDGDTARWARDAAGVDLSLSSTGEGLALVEPEYEEGDRPHVHEVDDGVAHHKVIDGEVRGEAPGFLAVLAPYQVGAKGADGPLEVTALETSDGQAAWAITTADGTDIAWLREPDATGGLVLPDGRTATTDAEFLLFDLDGTFTLLSRGSYASLDGSVFAASSAESGVALVE